MSSLTCYLRKFTLPAIISLLLVFSACSSKNVPSHTSSPSMLRVATYNVSLYGNEAGALSAKLQTGKDSQLIQIAAVIQHIRPDILLLNEIDYAPQNKNVNDFHQNYLQVPQFEQEAISYPYRIAFPSNTGLAAPIDLDGDGQINLPNDAYGYGKYPGQYAFALLSKYPIDEAAIQTFQKLKWKDMPQTQLPQNEQSSSYYDRAVLEIFRVSSKNHVVAPIQFSSTQRINMVLSHPTPPVFDGPEDRNGLRNYAEIKLLKDIIHQSPYLVDDNGNRGGIAKGEKFVIMGDLNADPIDGESVPGAIQQLLDDPLIHQEASNGTLIPKRNDSLAYSSESNDKGNPAYDTALWGKRVDYVLPSQNLKVLQSGIFSPDPTDTFYPIIHHQKPSDHLLVWVDIKLEK